MELKLLSKTEKKKWNEKLSIKNQNVLPSLFSTFHCITGKD